MTVTAHLLEHYVNPMTCQQSGCDRCLVIFPKLSYGLAPPALNPVEALMVLPVSWITGFRASDSSDFLWSPFLLDF